MSWKAHLCLDLAGVLNASLATEATTLRHIGQIRELNGSFGLWFRFDGFDVLAEVKYETLIARP